MGILGGIADFSTIAAPVIGGALGSALLPGVGTAAGAYIGGAIGGAGATIFNGATDGNLHGVNEYIAAGVAGAALGAGGGWGASILGRKLGSAGLRSALKYSGKFPRKNSGGGLPVSVKRENLVKAGILRGGGSGGAVFGANALWGSYTNRQPESSANVKNSRPPEVPLVAVNPTS